LGIEHGWETRSTIAEAAGNPVRRGSHAAERRNGSGHMVKTPMISRNCFLNDP